MGSCFWDSSSALTPKPMWGTNGTVKTLKTGYKGKGAHEPKAQTAGAYSGFLSMKHLGVLLLPPGRDASPSEGYHPGSMSPVPIYTPGWRETKCSKVPYLRKRRDGRGLNPGPPDPQNPHTPPQKSLNGWKIFSVLPTYKLLTRLLKLT